MVMRVLALGSCRLHEPLVSAHRRGEATYLNLGFGRGRPIYMHDVDEAIQFVRIVRGEVAMPGPLRRFAYDRGLRVTRGMRRALEQADRVVLEVCTDKHYEVAGWTLNVNELHRHLVAETGAAGVAWWQAIDRGQRPPPAMIVPLEAALRRGWRGWWRVDDGHAQVLRELAFRYLSADEIAQGLMRLQGLLDRTVLVVPHVVVRLPDGSLLNERLQHIEKAIAAAHRVGLPLLDPRRFVERDGQARVLDDGGRDLHHYARDYLPVVGSEIVEALRSLTHAAGSPSTVQRRMTRGSLATS